MTATQSPMVMLRELAEKALDEVTTQLGKARTAHRKAVEQLDQLLTYEKEYRQQFQQSLTQGISSSNWTNFNIFIKNLDEAIVTYRREVIQRDQYVQQVVVNWQEKKKRLNAFDILLERAENQRLIQGNRRDQKLMDEFAQRAGARKENL
ncbi:flagellar export protein FliJ [Erwinia sp. HR93]|uniref:flagellar export protein FliJ n=1 Tax=Erwinia sp. HR93 TaxID=3094840 RepID=UPI002ADEABF7|nr:flagellar export protein FliJ [Erwinia sp. HR93]MEA1063451.1 flagellar export protein FliJ [Erwinia sp. HR93]